VARDGWAEIWRRNYHELVAVPEAREVCVWAGTNDAKQNRSLEELNRAYRRIADEKRLGLVELAATPREYFADGIHLTQAGNIWVAERFAAAIEARR